MAEISDAKTRTMSRQYQKLGRSGSKPLRLIEIITAKPAPIAIENGSIRFIAERLTVSPSLCHCGCDLV
jgi:hypothetical protein